MKRKFSPSVIFGESIEKSKSKPHLPTKESLDRANQWVEKGLLEFSSGPGVTKLSKWRAVLDQYLE